MRRRLKAGVKNRYFNIANTVRSWVQGRKNSTTYEVFIGDTIKARRRAARPGASWGRTTPTMRRQGWTTSDLTYFHSQMVPVMGLKQ